MKAASCPRASSPAGGSAAPRGSGRALPLVGRQVGRYVAVGLLNTGLTCAIFTTLLKGAGVHYLAALLASWFCGMVFSYCLNFVWVFRQPDRLAFDHRFARFAVTGLVSIVVNLTALRGLVGATGGDPFWLQVALMPPIVGLNFLAAKFWSLATSGRLAA